MKISINEPCHENWDKMTPNDKGAFCLSCQKNVVDFSNKTISQIKDFFKEKTDSTSVCGRFEEEQLNEMSFDHFFNQFKNWKYFQKFALIAFFVFGFNLFGYGQTNNNSHIKMGKVAYVPQDTVKKCTKDTTQKTMIKGRVKSTNNTPKTKPKPQPQPKLMGDVMVEEKQK
ncbi:MAG: hypothetical protein Q7W45_05260 [Bacteroidota bacterium]|nr:hypothetical protein [Bacteroidota bacterium]MDP3144856.1 hypothetical protein [Bacteroidota bacterium]